MVYIVVRKNVVAGQGYVRSVKYFRQYQRQVGLGPGNLVRFMLTMGSLGPNI